MNKSIFLLLSFLAILASLSAQYSEKVISPKYLFTEFTAGKVFLKDALVVDTYLNYNTLNQEMLFKKDTSILKLDMPNSIDSVIIKNRVFIPSGNFFYETIIRKKLKLLVKNISKWDTEGAEVGYGKSKLAKATTLDYISGGGRTINLKPNVEIKIYDDSEYFISVDNKILSATKLKNYIELVPNLKSSIVTFTKKSKLNLYNKNDNFKLVLFINKTLDSIANSNNLPSN